MDLFDKVQWGTMLYSLFVFIILFLLLRKFAFGPLMNMMEQRATKIEADLKQAEQNRQDAQGYLAEQKKLLDQARLDAQTVMENARVTSEKQADDIIRNAKAEAEAYKESARTEILREKDQAIEALRAELGNLTVALAGKIIEKELDANKHKSLVDNYLKEVGTSKWVQ